MAQHSQSHIDSMRNFFKVVFVILLSILIISIIVLASVPPVSRDALIHHLTVPKLYLKQGGIYEIPDMVSSYYPMNLELLYMIPLYFGNDIIPKLIHFSFAMLSAGVLFFYLKKRINTVYALFGSLVFLSIPIIIKLSITVYVDLGLIFFSTASLLYLFKWIENHFRLKYLLGSAIWCGLALGTKYNGLITLLLLTSFIPFMYTRKIIGDVKSGTANRLNRKQKGGPYGTVSTQFKSVGYGLIFLIVSLIVFSPWMIRNYLWTKNPVYPLYDTYFNPPVTPSSFEWVENSVTSSAKSVKQLHHFSLRNIIYHESWWRIALIPVRIFFEGQDGIPQYFDGKLNPMLFFFPFFAFYKTDRQWSRERIEKNVLLAFTILFILFVFFLKDMRIRWIGPVIPPMVI